MLSKSFTMCCFYLISTAALCQTIDNTASFRMSTAERLIRLHYENDYFTGSDEYYTQGMNLEFISPALERNPLSKLLIVPKENKNAFGLAVEHNAYTPTSISYNGILYGDRPFAASLMMKTFAGSNHPSKCYRISSSLSLGMIGNVAGAYHIQRTIHKWINDTEPQGWQYQIKNDLVINYEAGIEKNIFYSRYFLLNGFTVTRLGTLNTKISIGGTMMLGKLNSAIISAFSGSALPSQKQKTTFHLYVQPIINTVIYDATLQGGIIFNRNSPYTLSREEIEHFTFQGNSGLVFTVGSLYVEYFQSILSKEFSSSHKHRWGGLRIGFLF